MAPPGTYTVQLTVNNEVPQKQPLTLLMDPASMGAEAEINEQLQMMLELRDNQNNIAGMLNEAELVRSQLYELRVLLRDHNDFSEINNQITVLDEKIIDLEMNLTDLRVTRASCTPKSPACQVISLGTTSPPPRHTAPYTRCTKKTLAPTWHK